MKALVLRPCVLVRLAIAILLSTLLHQPTTTHAQGTGFTYQGRLNDGSNPATGIYDLRFALFDAASIGNQEGNALTNTAIAVSNGLFTVTLDFGNQFPGADRWLEIGVRANGGGAFSTLSPRQLLTATPYATHANYAGDVEPGANVSFSANGVVSFQSPTPFYLGPQATNMVNNLNAQFLAGMDAGRFWWLGGNSGQLPADYVLGTLDNQPLELKVNGNRALRLEPGTTPNLIGGYAGNMVSNGFKGALIAGGGLENNPNRVGADFASVLGGYNNTASGFASTAIGLGNTAQGNYSTVIGAANSGLGGYSMVLGVASAASGDYATAMGVRAKANHAGSFVWADLTDADFLSTADNQFLIRATGGVGINTNNPSGAALAVLGDVKVVGSFKGGYSGNIINNGVVGGFIGGGGAAAAPNQVVGNYAAVVGGLGNTASGQDSTAMGYHTTASGDASTAMGHYAIASGSISTALGQHSTASGYVSTAIGAYSQASHDHTFVWSDGSIPAFGSSTNNQFLVNASGGVGINTTNPSTTLDVAGSFRVNGGSTFNRVQDGYFDVGPNATAAKVVTNNFPVAFNTVPNITATAANQAGTDWPDVYVVTVRRVTPTQAVFNILRVDLTGGWAQNLRINYHAWE